MNKICPTPISILSQWITPAAKVTGIMVAGAVGTVATSCLRAQINLSIWDPIVCDLFPNSNGVYNAGCALKALAVDVQC